MNSKEREDLRLFGSNKNCQDVKRPIAKMSIWDHTHGHM